MSVRLAWWRGTEENQKQRKSGGFVTRAGKSKELALSVALYPPFHRSRERDKMIFRYTILFVADVGRALDFYERAFGLQRLFLHEAGDYGELATGATKLAFSSRKLMATLGKTPGIADPKAPVFELAFETEDVPAALERAQAAGALLVQAARLEPWGQTTSYVSDPDGYLVEICSPVAPPPAQVPDTG